MCKADTSVLPDKICIHGTAHRRPAACLVNRSIHKVQLPVYQHVYPRVYRHAYPTCLGQQRPSVPSTSSFRSLHSKRAAAKHLGVCAGVRACVRGCLRVRVCASCVCACMRACVHVRHLGDMHAGDSMSQGSVRPLPLSACLLPPPCALMQLCLCANRWACACVCAGERKKNGHG